MVQSAFIDSDLTALAHGAEGQVYVVGADGDRHWVDPEDLGIWGAPSFSETPDPDAAATAVLNLLLEHRREPPSEELARKIVAAVMDPD